MTPCILVVDDEPPIVQLLVTVLTLEGYRTLEAPDGRQALTVAQEQHPDLVLTDLMMPHMNGAELCRELKSDARTRGIPLAIMSAVMHTVDEAPDADAVLPKPFDLDALINLVERYAGPPAAV